MLTGNKDNWLYLYVSIQNTKSGLNHIVGDELKGLNHETEGLLHTKEGTALPCLHFSPVQKCDFDNLIIAIFIDLGVKTFCT